MKKIFVFALGLILFGVCGACSSSHDRADFSDTYLSNQNLNAPNYAQLREIPVPEKAVMDSKKTLLFGSDPLIGRLVFSAPYAQTGLFDFYLQEMPKTGWREMTAVRSDNSFLTFLKDNRIATIRLTSETETTTAILIDISMSRTIKGN